MSDESLGPTLRTPEGAPAGGASTVSPTATFGRYLLSRRLGVGGMGEVFLGFDPALARPVALKVLKDGFSSTELLAEARATAKLSHPNVVAVYDVGEHEGRAFIAMEYVEGGSLAEWAREPRTWRECWAMLREAGAGLAAIHRAGLVHRDFKPANVLVGPDGRPRVSDFGLAAVQGTVHGADVAGTPLYMAPELWKGTPPSAATDVFAFAVACWELLAGGPPWDARSFEALREAQVKGPLTTPARPFPAAMQRVLTRSLGPREGRPASLDALLRELQRATWRRPVARASAALVAALTLGLGTSYAAERAACSAASSPEQVWSAEQRAAVAAAAPKAIDAISAWVGRWSSAREDVCRRRGEWGEASEGDRALVTRCLDTQAHRARLAVSSVLAAGASVDRRGSAVAVLVDAATRPPCRPEPQGPTPVETAQAVFDASTLIELSRAEDALTALDSLGADAGVEAGLVRVAALRDLGRHDVARTELDRVELLAEQLRDERARSRIAIIRAEALTLQQQDLPAARTAVERARTLVERSGGLEDHLHLESVEALLTLNEYLDGTGALPSDGGTDNPFEVRGRELAARAGAVGLRRFEIDGLELALGGIAALESHDALPAPRLQAANELRERLEALLPDTPRSRFRVVSDWVSLLMAAGRHDEALRTTRAMIDALETDPSPRATLRIASLSVDLLDRDLCVPSPRLRSALTSPDPAIATQAGMLAFVALEQAWVCEGPDAALTLANEQGLRTGPHNEFVSELLQRISAERAPATAPATPARFELPMAEVHWARLAGEAAVLAGDPARARRLLDRALTLQLPDLAYAAHSLETIELHVGVARLQRAVGDATAGRKTLDALVALDQQQPGLMPRRGRALVLAALAEASGKCEPAEEAQRLLEGLPSSPGLRDRVTAWRAQHCAR